MTSLMNKNVLLIGGARGLGRDLATECARLRSNIFIIHDKKDELEDTEHHIGNMRARVYGYFCDFNDKKRIDKLVTLYLREWLHADVLVNCIDAEQKELFFKYDIQKLDDIINREHLSQIRFCQQIYANMVERKKGVVVNIENIDYEGTDNIVMGMYSNTLKALTDGINHFAATAKLKEVSSLFVSRSYKNYYSTQNAEKIVDALLKSKTFIRL